MDYKEKAEKEFQQKIEALEKKRSDLGKQVTNAENDVRILMDSKGNLEKIIKGLSKHIEDKVLAAVSDALKRVEAKEKELIQAKENVDNKSNKNDRLTTELEGKVAQTDKIKKNLAINLEEKNQTLKEVEAEKLKLIAIQKTIQEILK